VGRRRGDRIKKRFLEQKKNETYEKKMLDGEKRVKRFWREEREDVPKRKK